MTWDDTDGSGIANYEVEDDDDAPQPIDRDDAAALQTLISRGRATDEREAAAEEREQAASRREKAVGFRERVTGERETAVRAREEAADLRDHLARGRDLQAAGRDEVAGQRDVDGARRDVEAVAAESEAKADTNISEQSVDALAAARKGSASDRKRAGVDRRFAAGDRSHAGADRDAAAIDRHAASTDSASALFDGLTGVLLRAPGFFELNREIARAHRTGEQLVLGFVDVVGFKAINDSVGHLAGDQVLRRIVDTLRGSLRPYDTIVRFGGDEFVCAVSGMSLGKVKDRFAAVNLALGEGVEHVEHASVTIGFAELQADDSLDRLLERADADLYRQRLGEQTGPSSSNADRS